MKRYPIRPGIFKRFLCWLLGCTSYRVGSLIIPCERCGANRALHGGFGK